MYSKKFLSSHPSFVPLQTPSMARVLEKHLFKLIESNDLPLVTSLLSQHSSAINVNARHNHAGWTLLHAAAVFDRAEMLQLLLNHPDIHLDLRTHDHSSVFYLACSLGNVAAVKVLLNDPRVKLNTLDSDRCSPLWIAAFKGHTAVIELLVASGRHITWKKVGLYGGKLRSPLAIAGFMGRDDTAALLHSVATAPDHTRLKLRKQLGLMESLAAEVFALIVFLCDDLLKLRSRQEDVTKDEDALEEDVRSGLKGQAATRRFFAMAMRLPMELQMVLAHRVIESAGETVRRKDSELAFRTLTKYWRWLQAR